jgi:small subunit ribosomal protein S27e
VMSMKELTPKPASAFLLVNCPKCNTENIVYSHTTTAIKCKSCKNLLAKNTGGHANVIGQIVKKLDNP